MEAVLSCEHFSGRLGTDRMSFSLSSRGAYLMRNPRAIEFDLLSYEEMVYMMTMKWYDVIPILKDKVKSVGRQ